MRIAATFLALAAFLAIAQAAAQPATVNDTLVNGAFTKPLETGWIQNAGDRLGSHTTVRLPDGGVRVFKEMCGTAGLSQQVLLKSTETTIKTRARFATEATNPGYYCAASILLGYLDKDGKTLGETRILKASGQAPWKNSATLHLVPVTDSAKWNDYAIDVAKELKTNLTGVDASKVKRLSIRLESYCSGTDAC